MVETGKHMNFIKRITRSNYYWQIFREHGDALRQLRGALADDVSRRTLRALLDSYRAVWKSPESYYLQAASAQCTEHHFVAENGYEVKGVANPYFLGEIFDLARCRVFLDGGAYIGDTIEQALACLPNLEQVYAFEPNRETYLRLRANQNIAAVEVQFRNQGLGDADAVCRFRPDGAGSALDSNGPDEIEVISAGAFVAGLPEEKLPDFIKLDIEGAEAAVIRSLTPFIAGHKPDIAVSVYHNLQDLWEIPLQLKKICPDYRIYLRHQSNYYTETVCFATAGTPPRR